MVATVLTVYGIETNQNQYMRIVFYVLKYHLPHQKHNYYFRAVIEQLFFDS